MVETSRIDGLDPTVPKVTGLVLLDNEGKRIAVQYFSKNLYVLFFSVSMAGPIAESHSYSCTTCCRIDKVPAQAEVEQTLFAKTCKTNARGEGAYMISQCVYPCGGRVHTRLTGGPCVQLKSSFWMTCW